MKTENRPVIVPELEDISQLDELQLDIWEKPIICRVEVDLPRWMASLTKKKNWRILSEESTEDSFSFVLQHKKQIAEITLYNNGYATVDIEGCPIFNGELHNNQHNWANLVYFDPDDGRPITLN